MPEADRLEVESAMNMKDTLIASSVTTLARNLYTSSARFVFELLQNAEDNHYAQALGCGEVPEVSFSLYPDRVVVECNEDGFTAENLSAICNVGKSSKTGAQGYIGEKGIGFKSVFMAAYRAHIQSGHFSFFFQHRTRDSGMGMVTPVWDDGGKSLGACRTRITLLLHDDGTDAERAKARREIRQHFLEIHDTILLFMKKLQRIKIALYGDDEDEPETEITYSIDRQADTRVAVTKSTREHGESRERVKYYHTTRHVATNLAKNDNRTYSAAEEASGAYKRGEVVLAFPLTVASVPVLENQWTFAFLPVQQMGFKFLIQADFVTQANRQGIVTTSARNVGLAAGIAEAFVRSVLQMCDHETLQYTWMRYVPGRNDFPWDSFWEDVIGKIEERVKATPVLRPPAPTRPLRLIRNSCAHTTMELDRHGAPLFLDVEPEMYLSLQYQKADLDRLRGLGLRNTIMREFIERAKHDLASASSRLKSPATDEDWHSRAARLLHRPFRSSGDGWAQRRKEVADLPLIPLRNGDWTPAKVRPPFGAATAPADVYFPQVALTDLAIPLDLALNVISLSAAANADRRKLFDALGAKTASANLVRDAIVRRHKDRRHPVALALAVQHVRFLYLTEHLAAKPMSADDTQAIRLFTHRGTPADPAADDDVLYLRDEADAYGPANSFQPIAADVGAGVGVGAPGFDALFLHDAYLQHPPPVNDGIYNNMSWTDWLAKHFDVRRHVPIANSDGTELSAACRYVAAHRPDKLVGMLREGWERACGEVISGEVEAMARELRAVRVPCRSGDVTGLRPLGEAFLPLADLVALGDRFLRRGDFFPWLALDAPLSHDTRPLEWEALGAEFGLGFERDLVGFGLAVLRCVVKSNPKRTAMVEQQRVLDLYEYLHAKVGESGSPEPCRERIRKAMRLEPCILYPLADGTHEWTKLEDCVWEAPVYLWEKRSLQNAYAYTWKYTRAPNDFASLAGFFTRTLGVPNCTREHLVDEVRYVARVYKTDAKLNHMRNLYKCLADTVAGDSSAAAKIRGIFHNEALICVLAAGSDSVVSWHSAAECLWSSATPIRGMHVLEALYGGAHGLKAFFTGTLGVSTVTAELVYGKLAGEQELPAAEAKEALLVFSAFLAARHDRGAAFAPGPVVDNAVFPVRLPGSRLALARGTDAFVLLDRRTLGADFAPLATVLDCTMDEVRALAPLVAWARLEDRYLSRSVKEITSADAASTRPISAPHRSVRRKAHALLRIAATFNSPRTRTNATDLYTLLRGAETLETDRITAALVLEQDGAHICVDQAVAALHIAEEAEGRLAIYVPRDEQAQEVCFNSKLPARLCTWLLDGAVPPPEAVNAVQSVLNAKPFALAGILDELGVGEVGVPEVEEVEEVEEAEPVEVVSPSRTPTPRRQRSGSSSTASSSSGGETLVDAETPPSSVDSRASSRSSQAGRNEGSSSSVTAQQHSSSYTVAARSAAPAPRPQLFRQPDIATQPGAVPVANASQAAAQRASPSRPQPVAAAPHEAGPDATVAEPDSDYLALLHQVVAAARRTIFPSRGAFDMSGLHLALLDAAGDEAGGGTADRNWLRSTSQLERDKRIGAAGELFVFELLSRLRLPGFSRANWQSTIRSYVTAHRDYADLAPWTGRETADIAYADADGALVRLLVGAGYLDARVWAGVKGLQCFVEVKATTGPCSAPFYMSKGQYKRMQNLSNNNAGDRQTDALYVVFRVFNLGTDAVGLCVLVDPESMRQRGELAFAAESWSVVAA
ncbi:hypothetical protein B0T24DRAFT_554720 [Lasiosphaeria ovina]|uniref:Protein NO VEIN C-terminal domain-containing protein n=1 Tax=Lasiosphaeria ovina TaxID=92902 RepID=A0AAE0K7J2_9PEZI|nr:hypothetical protein B0T24DRAFT_554720 [Lasiosphaeria ovina]